MHVRRDARDRYRFDDDLYSSHGPIVVGDIATARQIATKINDIREAPRYPESAVRAGELYALGLIEEIMYLVITAYVEDVAPDSLTLALDHVTETLGPEDTEGTLLGFVADFPPAEVHRRKARPEEYLTSSTEGTQHRVRALVEMVMLRLANENAARERLRDLDDDRGVAQDTAYISVVAALDDFFASLPPFSGAGGVSLLEVLRAPAKSSPTSVQGQLEYIRRNWPALLGDRMTGILDRLLRAIDAIVEEQKWGGLGFGPPPVLDAAALRGGPFEYERFSTDSSWMPRLVLIAKSTYVWLDQLSRQYGRDISKLDHIPDTELDRLAEAGITGLWLIGLWERSAASREIKRRRGDAEAEASAYALYDYAIAADLGGEDAYRSLRDRAGARGIRLASDMVPNHVGIDGRWVIEHPDWFLSLDTPPYPAYSYGGPDLCAHPDVSVHIEDHYWDGTDAAVVFKRYDHRTGDTRFIYHGNDGTSMPWNDTAQLNYLSPEVREGVIQTILHVARLFPIIRFDAAMTLAKRHIQRLWFPQPGAGGAIPSRSEHGMTAAELDRHLPDEFWREVVDRVASEVPDTLLLAEAFWMMEGYFVRTLGMHRVYNSAFMHMLAAESNGEYRELVKNVLEFDPEVMKRFVNFMNNPDEETAATQFGKDDKYFGVATLMATLPGLPMFGHGQIEGFTEKYGMEFRRPRWDEQPDQWLVDRHRAEIFPLLHRREQFAHVDEFQFYDVRDEGGGTCEDVYAYSNRRDGNASLVIYHNKFATVAGTVHLSVPTMMRSDGERRIEQRTLGSGLGLRAGASDYTVFRDQVDGREYIRHSRDLADNGLFVRLEAFKRHVFLDFREVEDHDGAYGTVAGRLGGGGTSSIDKAVTMLRLEPLHTALNALVLAPQAADEEMAARFLAEASQRGAGRGMAEDDLIATLRPEVDPEAGLLVRTKKRFAAALGPDTGYAALVRTAAAIDAVGATDRAGEWRLAAALGEALTASELDGRHAGLLPVALSHAGWAARLDRVPAEPAARRALADVFAANHRHLGVNEHEGVTWFNREGFEQVLAVLLWDALLRAPSKAARKRAAATVTAMADAAEASGYRVDRLLE